MSQALLIKHNVIFHCEEMHTFSSRSMKSYCKQLWYHCIGTPQHSRFAAFKKYILEVSISVNSKKLFRTQTDVQAVLWKISDQGYDTLMSDQRFNCLLFNVVKASKVLPKYRNRVNPRLSVSSSEQRTSHRSSEVFFHGLPRLI